MNYGLKGATSGETFELIEHMLIVNKFLFSLLYVQNEVEFAIQKNSNGEPKIVIIDALI